MCVLCRWLPDRDLVVVGDRTYATLQLLAGGQQLAPRITVLTSCGRMRSSMIRPHPACHGVSGQQLRSRGYLGSAKNSCNAVARSHPKARADSGVTISPSTLA